MKYTVYVTGKDGDGYVQSLGEFDDIEDIYIRTSLLADDVVITIDQESDEKDDKGCPNCGY